MKNKELYLLLFDGKKRKFVRINLLVEIILFACVCVCVCVCVVFFEKKICIFSYTFDLCGRVGDKKIFTWPISGNKTTFFGLMFQISTQSIAYVFKARQFVCTGSTAICFLFLCMSINSQPSVEHLFMPFHHTFTFLFYLASFLQQATVLILVRKMFSE